ncbi:hypothetical protein IAT38_008448 [Cryptococcus sp. DSM 104549]
MNNQKGNPGLPSKPYTPGPAPPLPAGPAPAQQQQAYAATDPVAHAAAWAAYYQAQGVTSGAAYSAAPVPAQPAAAGAPTVNNPYANYGYGAGAQHANTFQQGGPKIGQPGQSPITGPSQQYRPPNGQGFPAPGIQPQHGGFPQQQQQQPPQFGMQQPYNPQVAAAGYQPQQQRPPFQQPGQPGGQGWSGPQQPQGPGGPAYRPPGPQQPQQPQQPFQNFGPQQTPFYPQQQAYTPPPQQPFRPPPTPQPMQHNSPFRPPAGQMNGGQHQHRPPMSTPPHPTGGFPPAKRPRFDGPGGGMNGGAQGGNSGPGPMGGMNVNNAQARPPNNPPFMTGPGGPGPGPGPSPQARPPAAGAFGVGGGGGIGLGGAPGFNAQPGGPQPQPQNRGASNPPRGGAPPAAGPSRPPIHLGSGGPPPALPGFGAQSPGGPRGMPTGPARGGHMDASRGGRGGRGGGMMNAPRGPAGMRRQQGQLPLQDAAANARQRGVAGVGAVKSGEKEKKKKDKEVKATMTDFRIVGIEMKELGWSWGIIGGKWPESETAGEKKEEDKMEDAAGVVAPVDSASTDLTYVEAVPPPASSIPANGETAPAEPPKTETETDPSATEPTASEPQSEAPAVSADKAEPAEAPASASEPAEKAELEDKGEEEPAEFVEEKEKRGEKRKAKSPDDGDEGSSKKRASNYILTHKKPNRPPAASGPASAYESNGNRFRIYFDSPPELDRNPPKVKRSGGGKGGGGNAGGESQVANPNKRGRRDTSSVAPSRVGEQESETVVEEPQPQVVERTGQEPQAEAEAAVEATEVKAEVVEEANGEVPPVVSTPLPVKQEPVEVQESAVEDDTGDGDWEDPTPMAELSEEIEQANGNGGNHEAAVESEEVQVSEQAKAVAHGDAAVEHAPAGESVEPSAAEEVPGDAGADENVAPVATAPEVADAAEVTGEDGEGEAGDVSMISAANDNPEQKGETDISVKPPTTEPAPSTTAPPSPKPSAPSTGITSTSTPAEVAAALAASANNTASAYKSRTRRRSSVSSTSSRDYQSTLADGGASTVGGQTGPTPSVNRLSVVYGETKRMCFDAEIVQKVRIWRKDGRVEVVFKAGKEDDEVGEVGLPKGVLMETYDTSESRFISYSADQLSQLYTSSTPSPASADATATIPPLHRIAANLIVDNTSEAFSISLYLNKKSPLSEPKWCKTNQADAWLYEQFESRKGQDAGWRGKLEVMDPDPAPSLRNLLDNWASSSSHGTPSSRRAFISSLAESPNDLLEILLRLARGERNPTLASSSTPSFGPLATSIRPDSPFASHQTHVSLAILAMYRLTTDYAAKAGESMEAVEEKVGDIIRSLPVPLITKSLDGLFKEWQGGDGK